MTRLKENEDKIERIALRECRKICAFREKKVLLLLGIWGSEFSSKGTKSEEENGRKCAPSDEAHQHH